MPNFIFMYTLCGISFNCCIFFGWIFIWSQTITPNASFMRFHSIGNNVDIVSHLDKIPFFLFEWKLTQCFRCLISVSLLTNFLLFMHVFASLWLGRPLGRCQFRETPPAWWQLDTSVLNTSLFSIIHYHIIKTAYRNAPYLMRMVVGENWALFSMLLFL
jgi:hypothetical protein